MSTYVLRNYMEELVLNQLDGFLSAYPDACKCEICRYDIAALALNQLPPAYVASEKGALYSKVKSFTIQNRSDIIAALTQAIIKVSAHPNHDQESN